jgi:aerobic carbon-monoxide dehydrogenase large subunit
VGTATERPRQQVSWPEAPRLVAGLGEYLADVAVPEMAHMAIVRSPVASATVQWIDTSVAAGAPGVLAVVTAPDLSWVADLEHNVSPGGIGGQVVRARALASDVVRYVGEPVAVVVAESEGDARAAATLIELSLETRPPVLDLASAIADGAAMVQPSWRSNVIAQGVSATSAGRPSEGQQLRGRIAMQRATSAPMETRGYIGEWNRRSRRLTLYATAQNPHPLRTAVAKTLHLAETEVRVIAPRCGGSFGLKMHGYAEEILVSALSMMLHRPVRWLESREECLLVGAREHAAEYVATFGTDGVIEHLEVNVDGNLGAPSTLPGWGMTLVSSLTMGAGYRVPEADISWRAVATNKAPWNGARSYGKEFSALVTERIIERIAANLELPSIEIRRRNWLRASEFPASTPTGLHLDSGRYHDLADGVFDYLGVAAEQWCGAERVGHLIEARGIAFEVCPESVDLPGSLVSGTETATVRMGPDGSVTVLSGVTNPGGGNDRGFAQLVAETLGLRPDVVSVVQGDTDLCPYGRMLLCEPAEVSLVDGFAVGPRGGEQRVPIAAVADSIHSLGYILADEIEASLEATASYRTPNIRHMPDGSGHINPFASYSNAFHACALEVDTGTGQVRVTRHVVAHDCGTLVNEQLVEGQVKGAVVMGLGLVLGEELRSDGIGTPQSTTLKSYLMPRSTDVPDIEVLHQSTPSPFSFNGGKGAGEVGLGGAMAAAMGAINQALGLVGASVDALPLDPPRILTAIEGRRS